MGTVRLHASPGSGTTISDVARDLDVRRYVCPDAVERQLGRLFEEPGEVVVLAVTGPGGAGKSAALRNAARRAATDGYTVIQLDGRHPETPEEIAGLTDLPGDRTLLVVDEAEHLGAGLHALGRILAGLPGCTRVIVASRRLPHRWLPSGLEELSSRLRLAGLGPSDAETLLVRHGVSDPRARAAIADWAHGLPLALVLGASAWAASDRSDPARLAAALPGETEDDLIDHLAGPALAHLDPDLLAVTALAGGVDRGLLRDVLPDAEDGIGRLRECTFVELNDGRLTLHPRLAESVAARLRTADPSRARELTLRIAGHLRSRSVDGDSAALPWLARLVQDPALRSGLASPVGLHLYGDRARPGDGATIRGALEARWPGCWSLVAPWLPDTHVVRRTDGRPMAVVATLPLAQAADLDPGRALLVDHVLDHARQRGGTDRVVLTPFQLLLSDGSGEEPDPELVRIRNAIALQRCGVANPRGDYVVDLTGTSVEQDILTAYGYRHLPELDRDVHGLPVRVWAADVGPAGLAGLLYDAVAAEQGQPAVTPTGLLLCALEDFHDDAALASLPVAPAGLAAAAAAERVRAWVRQSVSELLADQPALLDLVTRRYLRPGSTHETVMRELFASRATYFRRLRRARALLAGTMS